MKSQNAEGKIKNLLERNVNGIINKERLSKELKSGRKLRIKLGIDPTGPEIHLGRAIALWKLKEFQDLGHQIVLIIGDFTGLIGDASDKKTGRPMLSEQEIKKNMAGYPKQVGKILDLKKTEFRRNSEWLVKLKIKDIIHLASLFTVHQMIDRRNFKERFKNSQAIGLHEFLYPLLQGYDSVAVGADVEIGGTDQLFNLKAGRKIQEFYKQKPQDIMTLEMVAGLDGQKMSTTSGNIINRENDGYYRTFDDDLKKAGIEKGPDTPIANAGITDLNRKTFLENYDKYLSISPLNELSNLPQLSNDDNGLVFDIELDSHSVIYLRLEKN